MLFQQDCNAFPLGEYTLEQLIRDFKTTSATGFERKGEGENRVTIVSDTPDGKGKSLRVKFPKGGFDSSPSGAQWKTDLGGTFDELYLSYYVKFESGFEFDKIGKLPGFGGGLDFQDRVASTEWSGKLMWREAIPEFYLHSPLESEKKYPWIQGGSSFKFQTNKWHHIVLHYRMNTVGAQDGLMEAWLDGNPAGSYTGIRFRSNPRVGITLFFFSTFFGGNIVDAPSADNYALFDEFVVSTLPLEPTTGLSRQGYKVSRGDRTWPHLYPLYALPGRLDYHLVSGRRVPALSR